ncbi:MAG: hypothetical protein ACM3SS_19935 [Rhodospirillaceae bacterium]
MKITEAIATATDVRVVYGLLEAYFEAVRAYDIALTLPQRLTRVPIAGALDVARRHAEARDLYARSVAERSRLDPMLGEFADVCRTAIQRLQCLDCPTEAAA